MKNSKSNTKTSVATKIFFEASSLRRISQQSISTNRDIEIEGIPEYYEVSERAEVPFMRYYGK